MIGVGGVLPASWALSCLEPLFSLPGGFAPAGERSSPASNAGAPIIVEASPPAACLPFGGRQPRGGGLKRPGGAPSSPLPLFSPGRIAGRKTGADLPRPLFKQCLTAVLSSYARRFSEPPSGVIKSPPALGSAPGQRAARGGCSGRGLGQAGHLHSCGGHAAPERLQLAPEELLAEFGMTKLQTHPEWGPFEPRGK